MKKRLTKVMSAVLCAGLLTGGVVGNSMMVSAAENGETAELVFWDMMWGRSDVYANVVADLVEKFNEEHENINVSVQMIPWDNFYQNFLTAVTSGSAPDISTGGFSQSTQYAVMDELIDLSSIVDEWTETGFIDQFPEGSIELHQYGDIQAGIPWICDPRCITYRADVFEELGIKEMPGTWEEFLELCERIKTETDMIPLVIPGDRDGAQVFLSMMFENGVGITDENGTPDFSDEKVGEVLDYVRTLYDKGYIADSTASFSDPDVDTMLLSGKAAMSYGALRTTIHNSGDPLAEQLRVMPCISGKEGEDARTLMWINPMVAYSQTKYPEECKVFIKWWVENMNTLFTNGGINGFPAVASMLEDSFYTEKPYIKSCIDNAVPGGTVPVWPNPSLYEAWSVIEGENYLGMALQEVVTGNTDNAAIQENIGGLIDQAFEDAE
ncbi:MAG: sugar ABC transporter substrate-binding protein [Eubacteriales bacterium]|nr:sugar ABC transporter substrate-binding protein [Eubacteriales bacterium]